MIVLLALVLQTLARAPCPLFVCKALENPSDCAQFNGSAIVINSQANGECGLFDILEQYWVSKKDEGNFTVQAKNDTSGKVDEEKGIKCENRDAPVDFVGQQNVTLLQSCTSDRDCLLTNGDYSPCVCALDGMFYCQPHSHSSLFDFFFEECKQYNNNAHISMWRKWWYSSRYYVQFNTFPAGNCSQRVKEIKEAEKVVDSALAVAVAAGVLLA